ncbi:copper-binding protein [Stutzerimonas stutzeri]|uniref:copper-binding protein n=1 Tax=Stutzerimonas stutzeri TaxID=316 RepID=UPI001C2E5F4B|nr:copper-binding protein [Stutzerimonas stutzeri]
MKRLISTVAVLALVPAAYAAETNHMEGMPMDHKGMNDMPMQHDPAAQTASATGTVKKIDPDKGTLTIAHGPVPELKWPAMVMGFAATPAQIAQVNEGDQVTFTFTSEGMRARITSIEKQ